MYFGIVSTPASSPSRNGSHRTRAALEEVGIRLTLEELANIPIFSFYSLSGNTCFPDPHKIYLYLGYPCFWFVSIMLFARNRARIHWELWTCRFAFLFLLYTELSLFWDKAQTHFTYVISITGVCTFLYFNYLIDRFTLNDVTRLLVWTLGLELIASIVLVFVLPRYGIDPGVFDPDNRGAWEGLFAQKNVLGACSAFAVAVAAGLRPKCFADRAWRCVLLVTGLICVAGSQSRESWIAVGLIVAATVFVQILRELEPRSRLPLVLGVFPLFFALGALVYLNLDTFLHMIGRTRTASGRTAIWEGSWLLFSRRPWLGYGTAGLWNTKYAWDVQARVGWAVTSSHNNYLEVLLCYGIIGFIVYIPIIGSSVLYIVRALLSYDLRDLQVLIYVMIVIFTISMAIAYIMYSPSFGMILLLFFVSHLEQVERSGFMRIKT